MMSFRQRWLLALLILQGLLRLPACPSTCKCMWKGGKQTVECINGKLITIPDGVDPGTQVLEFSENNLQVLPRERFQRMGLLHLQRIYLAHCRISQIDNRAFKGLSNLVELDLSHNLLNSVPTETFGDYPSLMRLAFSGNPIQKIKPNAFKHLLYLTTLELSNCQIEVIEPQGFSGLVNLEWLKLDGNRLSNIQGDKTLPESLNGILLHHNPWQCDCRLMDLYFWLLTYNVPHPLEPRCVTPPRVQGEPIRSLGLDNLACLPDVSPTTLYLEIAEGKNVSLLCRVSAIPEARVSWWFQGRILQNDSMVAPGIHLYYFVEEGTEEKRSELFILNTNTDDNGTFVCVAENPAGKAHSNYTIRIVVKEEPVVDVIVFSYEYLVTVSTACSVIIVVLVTCGVACAVRCQRSRQRRRKKERSKAVALQHHQLSSGKITDDTGKQIVRFSSDHVATLTKSNGEVSASEGEAHNLSTPAKDFDGPGTEQCSLPTEEDHVPQPPDPSESPPSLRNYALEQNPDLINDTGRVRKGRRPDKRSHGDGGDECGGDDERDHSANNSYQEAMENIIQDLDTHDMSLLDSALYVSPLLRNETRFPLHVSTLPRGSSDSRSLYHHPHAVDVHLSPGRFLDSDGYPIDYGLPKLHSHLPLHSNLVSETSSAFFRTLPHNRPSRFNTLATASSKAPHNANRSRTADIFTSSTQSYVHYSPADVRYTAEGYPCSQPKTVCSSETHVSLRDVSYLPSPPAPYKGEPCVPLTTTTVCTIENGSAVVTNVDGKKSSRDKPADLWTATQCNFHVHNIYDSDFMDKGTLYSDMGEQVSQCCTSSQTNDDFVVESAQNVLKMNPSKETVTVLLADNSCRNNSSTIPQGDETLVTEI